MTIQDTIAADQAAVAEDQAKLDADNATLAADQAKLASIQPHLALLDQIEAELLLVEQGIDATAVATIEAIRANISPLIAQMRALFTA